MYGIAGLSFLCNLPLQSLSLSGFDKLTDANLQLALAGLDKTLQHLG
jgi:hypothetical protein